MKAFCHAEAGAAMLPVRLHVHDPRFWLAALDVWCERQARRCHAIADVQYRVDVFKSQGGRDLFGGLNDRSMHAQLRMSEESLDHRVHTV